MGRQYFALINVHNTTHREVCLVCSDAYINHCSNERQAMHIYTALIIRLHLRLRACPNGTDVFPETLEVERLKLKLVRGRGTSFAHRTSKRHGMNSHSPRQTNPKRLCNWRDQSAKCGLPAKHQAAPAPGTFACAMQISLFCKYVHKIYRRCQ